MYLWFIKATGSENNGSFQPGGYRLKGLVLEWNTNDLLLMNTVPAWAVDYTLHAASFILLSF